MVHAEDATLPGIAGGVQCTRRCRRETHALLIFSDGSEVKTSIEKASFRKSSIMICVTVNARKDCKSIVPRNSTEGLCKSIIAENGSSQSVWCFIQPRNRPLAYWSSIEALKNNDH